MPYGIRIELNGSDITDKVSSFEITSELDAYCREISLDIADPDFYDTLDFSIIPDTPALEVLTRVDSTWVSQGKFFIEKPTFRIGIQTTETGIWGRSETARLGPPFAPKLNKTWDPDTTFATICDEMCDLVGLTWDPIYSSIPDFTVHARAFSAENLSPIEIIQQLLELAYGDDAWVTTDRLGHVVIAVRDRFPSIYDWTVDDPVTVSISEDWDWPDFGNRIRISSTGSTSGYSVQVSADNVCLSGNGASRAKIYARVTDQDGAPVSDIPVTWSAASNLVALDSQITNTQSIYIFDEEVRAKSFYEIDLTFPPALVRGIFAFRDVRNEENLATAGVTIDGNTVTLAQRLDYCDQLLRVTYVVDGVAINWATAGSTPGSVKVLADVSGQQGNVELYVENPCHCPPTITLQADPSSITVGDSSSVLAYVEIGGAPVLDGRTIFMSIDSSQPRGFIEWTQNKVGQVGIKNESCQARNEIEGLSQCQVASYPASVQGVYLASEDADGNRIKTGSNLYVSFQGKVITLNTLISSETELLVDYTAYGCAVNTYDGLKPGTDRLRAWIVTSREAPAEASTTITVNTKDKDEDPPPEDCCDDGLCESTGTPCDPEPQACEEGEVWCIKSGVAGCSDPDDCDDNDCEEGEVYCSKDGEPGCYPSDECDSTTEDGGTSKAYGLKNGSEGCWQPDELDRCSESPAGEEGEEGEEETVWCFVDGKKGCFPISECDNSVGKSSAEPCGLGEVCCENKVTGQRGCWPSIQCKTKEKGKSKDHDKNPGAECRTADGGVAKCKESDSCCEKGGVKGCWPRAACDTGAGCLPSSCQSDPTEECLNARFGAALDQDCSCSELCENEFSNLGTTQSYDEQSYRSIEEIIDTEHGLEPGTPEYDEKYDELKNEALEDCRTKCGDCENAEDLVVTGSDAVTSPGGYQYSATGGFAPHTWEVTGTGATIDDAGFVTLDETACGSFAVVCKDACGKETTFDARVTNNGTWSLTNTCSHCGYVGPSTPCADDASGKTRTVVMSGYANCISGCNCGLKETQCRGLHPLAEEWTAYCEESLYGSRFVVYQYEWVCS